MMLPLLIRRPQAGSLMMIRRPTIACIDGIISTSLGPSDENAFGPTNRYIPEDLCRHQR